MFAPKQEGNSMQEPRKATASAVNTLPILMPVTEARRNVCCSQPSGAPFSGEQGPTVVKVWPLRIQKAIPLDSQQDNVTPSKLKPEWTYGS